MGASLSRLRRRVVSLIRFRLGPRDTLFLSDPTFALVARAFPGFVRRYFNFLYPT